MAVVTLVEYLKNTRLSMNIIVNDILLRDVCIEEYEINTDKLWIVTSGGNQIEVYFNDFMQVDFDAISSTAYNSKDMINCLRELEEYKPFNAYLRDSQNKIIIGFYGIKEKFPSKF